MNLVFGDLNIIKSNIRNSPHVYIDGGHECDCEYCTRGGEGDTEYCCSQCSYKTDKLSDFSKGIKYICPSCKEELITQEEIDIRVKNLHFKYKK